MIICKEKDDALQVWQFAQTPEPWIRKITPKVKVSNLGRTGRIAQQFGDEPRVGIDKAVDFASPELLHTSIFVNTLFCLAEG